MFIGFQGNTDNSKNTSPTDYKYIEVHLPKYIVKPKDHSYLDLAKKDRYQR